MDCGPGQTFESWANRDLVKAGAVKARWPLLNLEVGHKVEVNEVVVI